MALAAPVRATRPIGRREASVAYLVRDEVPILSPLRYPGSKRRLAPYIAHALELNDLEPHLFIEPFAGGASVALQRAVLGSLAVFTDGPLALFGQGAWLHAPILRFFGGVNTKLAAIGAPPLLVIGIQKTGQVVEHVLAIERFLPDNRIYAIDDEYRYQHILAGRDPSTDGFGSETYYGQDFIYKTPSGKTFVFAVPYPVTQKTDWPKFSEEKVKIANYANLGRAVDLVTKLETDLYENAVIPIALAHRFTAISLRPGGRVLDVLTETALSGVNA